MIYVQVRFAIKPRGDYISAWIQCPTDNFSAAINSVEMLVAGYHMGCGFKGIIMSAQLDGPTDGAQVYNFSQLDELAQKLGEYRKA